MRSSPVRRLAVACAAAALLVAAGPAGAQAGTLLHWYPAEGDATDAVVGPDASNGTLLEDTVFGTGRLGQGFVFDGTDDLVTIPTNASFYPSGSATLEAWARTKDAGPAGTLSGTIAALYECAGFCPSNAANASFTLYVDNGRTTGFVRDDDASGPADQGQGQRISGGPLVDDAAFHHFVLLRDIEAGLLVLYVDGIGVAEQPLNGGADGPLTSADGETDAFTVGAQIEGGTSTPIADFAGTIDEVRLYSGTQYPDTTPPTYIPVVTGTVGTNGWYRSAVTVAWQVIDESMIRSRSGCGTTQLTASGSLTCQASSAGGNSSFSFSLKLDTVAPAVTCRPKPSFALGEDVDVGATVSDAGSGVVAASISAPAGTADAGTFTSSLTGRDLAGNSTTVECPFTVRVLTQVAIGQIATLPSPKACVSRRRFRIRLRNVKASKIVSAQIKLGSKTVRTVRGLRALGLPIDLRGLPKGSFKVTITVTNEAGAKRAGSRTYRTCVPKRRAR